MVVVFENPPDGEIPLEFSVAGGRVSGCVFTLSSGGLALADYLRWHTPMASAIAAELSARRIPVALLYAVEVDEESRGCGAGNALLQTFLEHAKALGATDCLLLCDEAEEQMPGFDLSAWYERCGFLSVYQSLSSGCLLMTSGEEAALWMRELHASVDQGVNFEPSM